MYIHIYIKRVDPSGNTTRLTYSGAHGYRASIRPDICRSTSPFPTRADRTTTLCGTQSAKLGRTRFHRVGRGARYRIERLDTRTDETSSPFSARCRAIDDTSEQRVHKYVDLRVVHARWFNLLFFFKISGMYFSFK